MRKGKSLLSQGLAKSKHGLAMLISKQTSSFGTNLPAVLCVWTRDKAVSRTTDGIPQSLESLQARHMREGAKEGRGREAEQARPQQRRPRQAHVDEPINAHTCARQRCRLRVTRHAPCSEPSTHRGARTHKLQEGHLQQAGLKRTAAFLRLWAINSWCPLLQLHQEPTAMSQHWHACQEARQALRSYASASQT